MSLDNFYLLCFISQAYQCLVAAVAAAVVVVVVVAIVNAVAVVEEVAAAVAAGVMAPVAQAVLVPRIVCARRGCHLARHKSMKFS